MTSLEATTLRGTKVRDRATNNGASAKLSPKSSEPLLEIEKIDASAHGSRPSSGSPLRAFFVGGSENEPCRDGRPRGDVGCAVARSGQRSRMLASTGRSAIIMSGSSPSSLLGSPSSWGITGRRCSGGGVDALSCAWNAAKGVCREWVECPFSLSPSLSSLEASSSNAIGNGRSALVGAGLSWAGEGAEIGSGVLPRLLSSLCSILEGEI